MGGDSELLLLPDEPFLLDGDDGKLFGVGGGLTVRFTSAPSSSRASEAPRLPRLLRLVLIYNTDLLIGALCEMEPLVMHCQVKAMGSTCQGRSQYKTSCHHKCDKGSIYLATGGHCKLIYSWYSVPDQPLMV